MISLPYIDIYYDILPYVGMPDMISSDRLLAKGMYDGP